LVVDSILRSSCRALLRPIASLVLKCGTTWREFSELSKSVFVSVASDEFGIRGRPTNVSRVSTLTGISRKEVKRQRELLAEPATSASPKTTDATRPLSGWHQDPTYVGGDGKPLALSPEGNERGQQFLEEVDDWLSRHRLDPNESETTPVRLGLGVCAIEGQLPKGT